MEIQKSNLSVANNATVLILSQNLDPCQPNGTELKGTS